MTCYNTSTHFDVGGIRLDMTEMTIPDAMVVQDVYRTGDAATRHAIEALVKMYEKKINEGA